MWWEQSGARQVRGTRWPALPAEEVGPRSNGGFTVIVPDRTSRYHRRNRTSCRRTSSACSPLDDAGRRTKVAHAPSWCDAHAAEDPAQVQSERRAARQRLEAVRRFMVNDCGIDPEDVNVLVVTSEAAIRSEEHPTPEPAGRSTVGGCAADQSILPGEHGFRFFPVVTTDTCSTPCTAFPSRCPSGISPRARCTTTYARPRSRPLRREAAWPVITTRSADLSVTEQLHAMLLQMQNGEFDPLDIQQFLGVCCATCARARSGAARNTTRCRGAVHRCL